MGMSLLLIIQTITDTADNTFVGTFLAGTVIAFIGLKIYQKQKEIDANYNKKLRIQELATILLAYINVSVKDFKGQISVHDGTNAPAKALFNKMSQLSPGYITNEILTKFNGYISNINRIWNELNTILTLDPKNEERVITLTKSIPSLIFILSTSSTLQDLTAEVLQSIKSELDKYSMEISNPLNDIINQK